MARIFLASPSRLVYNRYSNIQQQWDKTQQNSGSYVTLLRKSAGAAKTTRTIGKTQGHTVEWAEQTSREKKKINNACAHGTRPFYYTLETKITILHEKEK